MGYLGGMHFWWPKISGRMYPEGWARFAALLVFVGIQPDILPAIHPGLSGDAAPLSRVSAGISGAQRDVHRGCVHTGDWLCDSDDLLHLVVALRQDCRPNPWGAVGLEWQTSSPPPTENFVRTPVVTEETYHYSDEEKTNV